LFLISQTFIISSYSSGKKLGTFLQGLKDTGADPGELGALQ